MTELMTNDEWSVQYLLRTFFPSVCPPSPFPVIYSEIDIIFNQKACEIPHVWKNVLSRDKNWSVLIESAGYACLFFYHRLTSSLPWRHDNDDVTEANYVMTWRVWAVNLALGVRARRVSPASSQGCHVADYQVLPNCPAVPCQTNGSQSQIQEILKK